MPLLLPAQPTPPDPDPAPVITDQLRAMVLDEQRAHCAASTFDKFVRSLRANDYPLDVTSWIS